MNTPHRNNLSEIIGDVPYRLALAGGWIDQPFVSKHNPSPPGSMVVVSVNPTFPIMDRCGMATSTRKVAMEIWKGRLPDREPAELVEELYKEENSRQSYVSGSQDMVGIVYPGISRLDYDFNHEGGIFPKHIERNTDPDIARWFESVFQMIPYWPRPAGYDPIFEKNLDPEWVERLGQAGKDCFDAIVNKDLSKLGNSLTEAMKCWHVIVPHSIEYPGMPPTLLPMLKHYQANYAGAMYSGPGGGYYYVISDKLVPGGMKVSLRIS